MYRITVTEEQLQAIRDACEIKTRLHIGQLDEALRCCYDRDGRSVVDYDTIKAVEAIIKPLQGLTSNSSWGVGAFRTADRLWEIYSTIRHRLSWDRAYREGIVQPGEPRNWSEMMGVQYDEPVSVSGEPLPKVENVG